MTTGAVDSRYGGAVIRGRQWQLINYIGAGIALIFTVAYLVELISKGKGQYAAAFAVALAICLWFLHLSRASVEADPAAAAIVVRNPFGHHRIPWNEIETFEAAYTAFGGQMKTNRGIGNHFVVRVKRTHGLAVTVWGAGRGLARNPQTFSSGTTGRERSEMRRITEELNRRLRMQREGLGLDGHPARRG